jgi:hypothetical protein
MDPPQRHEIMAQPNEAYRTAFRCRSVRDRSAEEAELGNDSVDEPSKLTLVGSPRRLVSCGCAPGDVCDRRGACSWLLSVSSSWWWGRSDNVRESAEKRYFTMLKFVVLASSPYTEQRGLKLRLSQVVTMLLRIGS